MKRVVCLISLIVFALSGSLVSAAVHEAQGTQTIGSSAKGTSLQSGSITVGEYGVKIVDYQATCAQTVWLEKQSGGNRATYKKFYDLSKLKNFVIDQPGTYFIYPVPGRNCQRAIIVIRYQDLLS